jgi:hypothetical protein
MNPSLAESTRQSRKSIFPFFSNPLPILGLVIAAMVLALIVADGPARAAATGAYSLEVLVNGVPLAEHSARGTTYVEAVEGAEYTVRLSNRTSERVAIALSVDGLNSIDAKTTDARGARKWILGPWETIDLEGWQTSSTTARRFYFTTERESYGTWLGKTKNLGIISAAVFRERQPVARVSPIEERFERSAAAGAPAAPTAPSARGAGDSDASAQRREAEPKSTRLSDELAATGIGRELGHDVRRVHFDAEDRPAALIDIRYEYHDALVRLGVLPRPRDNDDLTRRERSAGFEDLSYSPDPYRSRKH